MDDCDLFFWDDDFALLFKDGFVKGIGTAASGLGAVLGYSYQDVYSIFTDAGIRAPLLLVGTETAFQTAEEAEQEMRLLNAEKLLDGIKGDGDDHTDAIDDSDLPFS